MASGGSSQTGRREGGRSTRSEMFDRLAELGASLQTDLAEAMERNDEKQQTGLAETARILDQKLEQTNAVVHEQLEQLDRVMSSAHEEVKQRVTSSTQSTRAPSKRSKSTEKSTKFQEEHGKVLDAHQRMIGSTETWLQNASLEDLIAGLEDRFQESQAHQENTSDEITKVQAEVRSLATAGAWHDHAELASSSQPTWRASNQRWILKRRLRNSTGGQSR